VLLLVIARALAAHDDGLYYWHQKAPRNNCHPDFLETNECMECYCDKSVLTLVVLTPASTGWAFAFNVVAQGADID
jgi:hypothetical protein